MDRDVDTLEQIASFNCVGITSGVLLQAQALYKKSPSWIGTTKPYSSRKIAYPQKLPHYIQLCEKYCEYTSNGLKEIVIPNLYKGYSLFLTCGNSGGITKQLFIGGIYSGKNS